MAQFNAKGISELGLSLKEIEEIPDEVAYEMLDAAAEVVTEAQKRSLRSLGLVDTGKLANSITAYRRKDYRQPKDQQRYVIVHPDGQHHTFQSRVKTKTYKRSKSGRQYTTGGKRVSVSASEVGFIHEFGAPKKGIAASQWMSRANEASAAEAVEAELAVYDRWLKSKNL